MLRNSHRIARSALAVALALGTATGALVSAPAVAKEAKAAGPQLSPQFRALAGPLQNEIQAAAKANNAAAATAAVPKLEAAMAAAQTPDDKFFAGQFGIQISQINKDKALQRKALQMTVDSGKLTGPDLGKFAFYLGASNLENKDYAGAQAAFAKAQAAGSTEADLPALMAESYFGANQNAQGLDMLYRAIEARRTAGTPAPREWYVRGLSVAYKNKMYDQAYRYSAGLVAAYPTTDNWGDAIGLARTAGKFQAQETLDVMRLAERTKSLRETNDYSEYLQAADARRSPGEVLKVVNQGIAAGKLSAGDVFVSENRTVAQQRLAADKASLPALERDARAPSAPAATVMAAADAFLSYDDPVKAEALYRIAMTKPGVDNDRLNTRLGIALCDQGKYADAQAMFAKVGGVRKPIGELWGIYAAQKAKGA